MPLLHALLPFLQMGALACHTTACRWGHWHVTLLHADGGIGMSHYCMQMGARHATLLHADGGIGMPHYCMQMRALACHFCMHFCLFCRWGHWHATLLHADGGIGMPHYC